MNIVAKNICPSGTNLQLIIFIICSVCSLRKFNLPNQETSYLYSDRSDHAKIVVGIPCYNEENTIAKVVARIPKIVNEIIVIDDGSSDMTASIASALNCRVISHPRNLGKGAAMRSLFLEARRVGADVLITLDGDGQHDVTDIPNILSPILKGECDIAIGARLNPDSCSDMPRYRKMGTVILNSVINSVYNGLSVRDTQSGFRAYNKKAFSKIMPGEESIGVDTEILAIAANLGLRISEYPTKIKYNGLETSTHNPIRHSLDVILTTLKIFSLHHPLMFYGVTSLAFFISSLIAGLWTLAVFERTGKLLLNFAFMTVACFVISSVMIGIGILIFSLKTAIREISSIDN
jgi:glycosyltransferase involved in cell wall biosynthesis